MIQLNLLPEELRIKVKKQPVIQFSSLPFLPVAVGGVIFLILVHILSFFIMGVSSLQLSSLAKKWKLYEPKKAALDSLMTNVRKSDAVIQAIDDLSAKRVLWARLMNDISDSMLPNMWLTNLYFDSKQNEEILMLEGFVAGPNEEATSSVGKFINALKENESFYINFKQIEADLIRSSRYENQDVMRFRLVCNFKAVK